MNFHYKPLPAFVDIMPSKIEGKGLFALWPMSSNTSIGISHIEDPHGLFENGLIRTSIGGFVNHSATPNCVLEKVIGVYTMYFLITFKVVEAGEELTVDYNLHKQCGYTE